MKLPGSFTSLHRAAADLPRDGGEQGSTDRPTGIRSARVVAPGVPATPIMGAGVQPSTNVCQIACAAGKALCYASPVPNFICDAAYAACMSLC